MYNLHEEFEDSQRRRGFSADFVQKVGRRRLARERKAQKEALRIVELGQAKAFMRKYGMPEWVRAVVFEEAEARKVTPLAVLSERRFHKLVRARWAIWYRIKAAKPKLSSNQIAHWFGDRDHTTIIHAIARHGEIAGLPALTTYDIERARQRYVRFHARLRSLG